MNFFNEIFNRIINTGVGANGVDANGVDANGIGANGISTSENPIELSIPKLVGPNESCIKRRFKSNFLEQGKTLNREQLQRSEALRSNIRDMNESIMEGFSELTSNKNSSQISDTTTYSNDFDKNIDRYNKEYPIFIDETRNAVRSNNRNIKDNPVLFKNDVNKMYYITYDKEGCYKTAGASGLELQSDMNNPNGQTCSTRAFDLGYNSFAISKGSGDQNVCSISKNISQAKGGGIATKPITSFSFKTSVTANVGELLRNGQIGIYNYNIDNNLVTDLTGKEGCDMKSKEILVNENSLIATWGANCKNV